MMQEAQGATQEVPRGNGAEWEVPRLLRPPARPRVLIADGDPIVRRAIRDVLQEDQVLTVVGEASDGVQAVELAVHYRPELVLIESALPRLDGIEATRRIGREAPGVNVVMLSATDDAELGLRALCAGAAGFLSKEKGIAAVARSLSAVIRGEAAISRSLTARLIEHAQGARVGSAGLRPVHSALTTREWEVLDMLRSGASTTDMAAAFVVSEDTVYSHIKNILRKLGVHSRSEAIVAARRLCGDG